MNQAWARALAVKAHGEQKYGDVPYEVHLDAVVAVLKEFGNFDEVSLCAGYLHDVLEDTQVTKMRIWQECGDEISILVELLTDQPGRNRAERHAATYPGIALHPKAVTLKLADRIANVRASRVKGKEGLLRMYQKEYGEFKAALKGEHHGAMWAELDRLLTEPALPATEAPGEGEEK